MKQTSKSIKPRTPGSNCKPETSQHLHDAVFAALANLCSWNLLIGLNPLNFNTPH